MRDHIKGEESPNFTNTLGESISLVIGADAVETANCLVAVLNGQQDAAEVLAAEVHSNVNYCSDDLGEVPEMPADFDYANVGIWIDPIGRGKIRKFSLSMQFVYVVLCTQ